MDTKGRRWCVALLVAIAPFAGCGSEPFAQRDPAGYQACSLYAEASSNSDASVKVGGLLVVGKQARRAGTKAIRDSAKPLFDKDALEASGQGDDFPMVDARALKAACKDAGFEF